MYLIWQPSSWEWRSCCLSLVAEINGIIVRTAQTWRDLRRMINQIGRITVRKLKECFWAGSYQERSLSRRENLKIAPAKKERYLFPYYIKISANYSSSSLKVGISVTWEIFIGFPFLQSLTETVPTTQNTWCILRRLWRSLHLPQINRWDGKDIMTQTQISYLGYWYSRSPCYL